MQNPKKEENNIGQARIEENFEKLQIRKFKKAKSWSFGRNGLIKQINLQQSFRVGHYTFLKLLVIKRYNYGSQKAKHKAEKDRCDTYVQQKSCIQNILKKKKTLSVNKRRTDKTEKWAKNLYRNSTKEDF